MNRLTYRLQDAIASLALVFCKLARIQFEAPWKADSKTPC